MNILDGDFDDYVPESDNFSLRSLNLNDTYNDIIDIAADIGYTYSSRNLHMDTDSMEKLQKLMDFILQGKELLKVVNYVVKQENKLICAMLLEYYYINMEFIDDRYKNFDVYAGKLSEVILSNFNYNDLVIDNAYLLMTVYMAGYITGSIQLMGWKILIQEGVYLDEDIVESLEYDPKLNLIFDYGVLFYRFNFDYDSLSTFIVYYYHNNMDLLRYFEFFTHPGSLFQQALILHSDDETDFENYTIYNVVKRKMDSFINDLRIKPIKVIITPVSDNFNPTLELNTLRKYDIFLYEVALVYDIIRKIKSQPVQS